MVGAFALLATTASAEIFWETDLNAAQQRAAAEDKLVFIDFYSKT